MIYNKQYYNTSKYYDTTTHLPIDLSSLNISGKLTLNGSLGSPGQVLVSKGGDTPTWQTVTGLGNIDLTSEVTGILPIINGGTGLSTLGTANQVLKVNSGGTALEYGTISVSLTLAQLSAASTTAPNSLYTMTSTIPVEFRTSGSLPLLYLDETNARIGIGVTTPSAQLSVTKDNIGVTQNNANGIVLANNTAATAGNQQMSPGLRFRGQGWKTNATAGSQTVDWLMDVLPVQGAANPTSRFQLKSSVNGAAYTTPIVIESSGNVGIGTVGPTAGLHIISASANVASFQSSASANMQVSFDAASNYNTNLTLREGGVDKWYIGSNGAVDDRFYIANSGDTKRLIILQNGDVGVGMSKTSVPERSFHIRTSDAVTNAVTYAQRNTHITSGTAIAGFGTGIEYELENGSGTNVIAATEEITWSDPTNHFEDSRYSLKLITDGALLDYLNMANNSVAVSRGYLVLGSQSASIYSATAGAAYSPVGRGIVITSSSATQGANALTVIGSSSNESVSNILSSHTFSPVGGTNTFAGLQVNPTINQTGGASGITRGVYVNPTLTAAADWRSIETSNTTGYSIYTASAPSYFGGNVIGKSKIIFDGTTTSSGAGAIGITGSIHEITTTGTGDALTLADGTEGQRLTVVYVAQGTGTDTAIVTPTNFGSGTTITFSTLGQSARLIFTNGKWYADGDPFGAVIA